MINFKMIEKPFVLLFLLCLLPLGVSAQSIVKGSDPWRTRIGATVKEMVANCVVIGSPDGKFSITLQIPDATLTITYAWYGA